MAHPAVRDCAVIGLPDVLDRRTRPLTARHWG